MKIQHLAIIFIMIILPISMVISYYINAEIQTIKQQELYDAKLVTATYDAVKSFQLNTINNKYSSVSDSKIRDIEAAISSFYNSLGTELGATGYDRNDLSTFIPAIVFSMYDGYYVYGKYYDESIPVYDETNNITGYGDYRIGLKPYVYYACRYKKDDNNDFVVNYTLDNTISIYGKVKGKDVTYSGALINIDNSRYDEKGYKYYSKYGYYNSEKDLKEVKYAVSAKYKGVDILPEVLTEDLFIADENGIYPSGTQGYQYIVYNDQKIYVDTDQYGNVVRNGELYYYIDDEEGKQQFEGVKCFWNNKNKKQYVPVTDIEVMTYMNKMIYKDADDVERLHSNAACQYVADAWKFSDWVNRNIGDIQQKHAVDQKGIQIKDFDTDTKDSYIFDVKGNRQEDDPTYAGSAFNENRICVIKKIIKTNLTAEMASFNVNTGYECGLPNFTEEDWGKIVSNMCVSVFMQGMPIGMKYYNNYCIVPNDKNKEVVTEDSIYIITDDDEAHYPGCAELVEGTKTAKSAYRNIDFERQTVVTYSTSIDEKDEKDHHFYPHSNQKSYNCMVNAKTSYELDDIINNKKYVFDEDTGEMVPKGDLGNDDLRRVYITALLREKYQLYRLNGYFGVPIKE